MPDRKPLTSDEVRVRMDFSIRNYNTALTTDQLESMIARFFVKEWHEVLGETPTDVVVEVQ